MITLAAVLTLMTKVAELGASPAVQQLLLAFLADALGVDQKVLDAAVVAQKDAPPPRKV